MDTNLSARETQILRLVAAGMTTKEIAGTLSIAESTVNWHVGNALAKLGASSRAEAVAIMLRDGPPEAPVVLVRPRPRAAGWQIAAAIAALLLAVAGGTSAAAYVLTAHQSAPRPAEATEPAAPATTVPPSNPSPGGRGAPATPSAAIPTASPVGVPAPATPTVPSGAASTIAPVSTPAVSTPLLPAPTLAPTLLVPALPTASGLPIVPSLLR